MTGAVSLKGGMLPQSKILKYIERVERRGTCVIVVAVLDDNCSTTLITLDNGEFRMSHSLPMLESSSGLLEEPFESGAVAKA